MRSAPTCYSKWILAWKGPFSFYEGDVGGLPSDVPGVYILEAFTPRRAELVPYYVGQSGCLRRRLTEHLTGGRTFARHLRQELSTYFHVAAVISPVLRTAVEASLIRCLTPAGNAVVPDAPILLVNLPSLSLIDP